MVPEPPESYRYLYPGEWVALAHGEVVAHGLDLHEVAQEACLKASDIAFERVPDPRAALWRRESRIDLAAHAMSLAHKHLQTGPNSLLTKR